MHSERKSLTNRYRHKYRRIHNCTYKHKNKPTHIYTYIHKVTLKHLQMETDKYMHINTQIHTQDIYCTHIHKHALGRVLVV